MIGHASVELSSDEPNDGDAKTPERFFTGMTSDNQKENRELILFRKRGLGVLFHQYDGYLESADFLDREREQRLKRGNFSFVRFQLSLESYERARRYLHEYRARKVDRYYGLPHRPRHAEGSGCSAFAVSVAEVAGVMNEELKRHWSLEVKVPERYLENVPAWRLLWPNSQNLRWAEAQEPGKSVFFYDPDRMHAWVKALVAELKSSAHSLTHPTRTVVFEKNTWGIAIDSSAILPLQEPIWFD